MPNRKEDMIGKTFGRLTIKQFHHKDSKSNNYYLTSCTCGSEKLVVQNHLLSGKIKSCGCLRKRKEMVGTGGDSKLQELNRLFISLANRNGINFIYQLVGIINSYLASKVHFKSFNVVLIYKA
jgi:hypothetical protein